MSPEPEPLPDSLEAQAARAAHVFDDGCPLPVSPPHRVLLEHAEGLRVRLAAVVECLVRKGITTREHLDAVRQEILAAEQIDCTVGAIADGLAAGVIQPWPLGALDRAEQAHAHPCCRCAPAPPPAAEEESR